ncbi:MAG: hypothetical protein LBJ72_12755 [Dysgonamonadaceae bacterium]|nr:hypothetical protein [Dysgonamonadaceae bacterium]
MKQFITTKLFSLLEKLPENNVSVSEWKQSYESFANEIFTANAKSSNYIDLLHSLSYTRAELVFLQEQKQVKKNIPVSTILQKSILLLDTQMYSIERQICLEKFMQNSLSVAPEKKIS